jgi:hypothetical protein
LDRFPQAIVGGHHFHYINIGKNVVGTSDGTSSQCVCGVLLEDTERQVVRRKKVGMSPWMGSIFLHWRFIKDKLIHTEWTDTQRMWGSFLEITLIKSELREWDTWKFQWCSWYSKYHDEWWKDYSGNYTEHTDVEINKHNGRIYKHNS